MQILKEVNADDLQIYLRLEPIMDLEKLEKRIKKIRVISCNFISGYKAMIEEIKKYELQFSCKKRTGRGEARYGMEIIMLLPIGDWSHHKLVSLSAKFVCRMVGKETGLKYISFTTKKGKAQYMHIYVYDREFIGLTVAKRYKRDFIVDKKTKQVTTKDNPEAIVLHKKGEIQKDKFGKPVKEMFKSTKTRIFAYKDGQFES